MMRWLSVWVAIGLLFVGTWVIQNRLTRLEQAKVSEDTLKRMVEDEFLKALLEQAVALQQALPKVIPEYPHGRKALRWKKKAP